MAKNNLNEIINDSEKFYNYISKLENKVLNDYKIKDTKLSIEFNGKTYKTKISNLLTQLILFIPFVDMESDIPDKFLILDKLSNFTSKLLTNYFNNIINYLGTENTDKVNLSIKKVIEELSNLSGKFNILTGSTINIMDLMLLYNKDRNSEFAKLINFKIPNNLEFNEIESVIDESLKRMVEILTSTDETCLYDYLKSDTGIKKKQLQEIILSCGLKPDLDGMIIPDPIDTNFLWGYRSIKDYYINTIGSRKALVTNYSRVKQSGYLTRKLSLLVVDTKIDENVDDCKTPYYMSIDLDNERTMERYHNRYYLDEDDNTEKIFTANDHSRLLNRKVKFRSPVKCLCKNGKICKRCYGSLYNVNKKRHVGILAILYLTCQLTQKMLSAKHLLQTNSDKIEWDENFHKYFIVDRNQVYPNFEEIKSFTLMINENNIQTDEDNKKYVNHLYARTKLKENEINLPMNLYLSDTTLELTKTNIKDDLDRFVIPVKQNLYDEESAFYFNFENNELSATLDAIIDLIDTDKNDIPDIDDFTNTFIRLLNESDVVIDAIHIELIIHNLVRDINNDIIKATKFDSPDDYQILRVSSAILKSASPSVSLAYERIKQQLQTPDIYFKDGVSEFDTLFKE